MSTYHSFRAATIREALEQVRAALGEDAVILSQREVRRRRFPWRRAIKEMELTAAIGPAAERVAANSRRPVDPVASVGESFAARPVRADSRSASSCVSSGSFDPAETIQYSAEVEPAAGSELSDPFRLYTHLIEQAVEESDAREIVGRAIPVEGFGLRIAADLQQIISRTIQDLIPCNGPIQLSADRQRVAALVGPTGVGKTTTIAKLAAQFRIQKRRRVGLITVDTYRVAAIEQLRTYAELIDVPLRVVGSPRQMPQALDELSDMDLVLIDTAGRSPQDDLKIQELRAFLQAARADEVHLVLSLTSGARTLALAAEKFQRVGPTSVLLTKLDEAGGAGAVLSAARRAARPISYITTGQDVPDDIEIASAERIVQRLLPLDAALVGREQPQAVHSLSRSRNSAPDASRRYEFIDCRNPIKTDYLDSRS